MCIIVAGAAAAGTVDGFGEGQAVARTIISKFSSQPVTAVVNEDVDNEGTNDQHEDDAAADDNYAKGDPL